MAERLEAQLTVDYSTALRGAQQLDRAIEQATQATVDLDVSAATREIDSLAKRSKTSVAASLNIDTKAAAKELDSVEARFRKLVLSGRVDIDSSDTRAAVDELEAVRRQLDSLAGTVDVDDSDVSAALRSVQALDRQLDGLSRSQGLDGVTSGLGDIGAASTSAASRVGGLAAGFKSIAPAAGLTTAAAALKDVTFAAADLGEQQSRAGVVWEDSAASIERFSRELRGIPTTEALTFANGLGSQLQNLGFDADTAGAKVEELIGRSVDLSSQNNIETSQSIEALSAALRGEYEQLEQVNVFLSDQVVREKAVALGLAESTAAVDNHGKAQATMALFLEQSARAKGDFDRTFDSSLPNQLRQLNKEFEDAKVSIGKAFLPAVLDLVKGLKQLGSGVGSALRGTADLMARLFGEETISETEASVAALEDWTAANLSAADAARLNAAVTASTEASAFNLTNVLKGSVFGFGAVANATREANNTLAEVQQSMTAVGLAGTAVSTTLASTVEAFTARAAGIAQVGEAAGAGAEAIRLFAAAVSGASPALREFIGSAKDTVAAGFDEIRAKQDEWRDSITGIGDRFASEMPKVSDAVGAAQLTVDNFSLDGMLAELDRLTQATVDTNVNQAQLLSQGFDDIVRQGLTLPAELRGLFYKEALAAPADLAALEARFESQAGLVAASGALAMNAEIQTGFDPAGITAQKVLDTSGVLQNGLPPAARQAGVSAGAELRAGITPDLDALAATIVTPTVSADVADGQAKIRRVKDELDDTSRRTATPSVQVDTGNSESEIQNVRAGLNAIPQNVTSTVTVQASVDGALAAARNAAGAIAAMFRFAGGPVESGTPYIVNELGREGWLSSRGFQWIPGGPQVREFPRAGVVVPHTIAPQVAAMSATKPRQTPRSRWSTADRAAIADAVADGVSRAPVVAASFPDSGRPHIELRRLSRRVSRR